MNRSSAIGQLPYAHGFRPAISLNVFVGLLILVSACAATAQSVSGGAGVIPALLDGLLYNKVLWLCLAIALWHLCRNHSPTLGARQLLLSMPALLFAGIADGLLPWIGLSLSLTLLLLATPGWGNARTGVLIALAAALHKIMVVALGELGGDSVLQLEAQLAGFLASGFLPGLEVEGNALQVSSGHMVVLVWGCSSLSNLGDALLLFWSLVSVRVSSATLQSRRVLLIGYLAVLACATIALNLLRLILMVSDPEVYAYLHGSEGSAWFRSATLGLTALMGTTVFSR